MRFRLFAALAAVLISGPAIAYDAAKAPRYASPDMYRPNVDRIILNGPGSTGDVSGMSVTPNGGSILRLLKNRFIDTGVSVLDYGPNVGTGGDDSAAINAAIAAAQAPGGAGKVIFPAPLSGAYNVCADAARIQATGATPGAILLEGNGANQVTIRAMPGCSSGAIAYSTVYINAGYSANPKSANRIEIRNLRIDGYGLSLCPLAVDYAVGLTLRGNVIRNAKAGTTGAADMCITAGYETTIDHTNRFENVNDAGNTLYTASTLPDYNFKTSGTDSLITAVAVNAKIAHFYNAAGGNNNYSNAHGWGYAPGNPDGQGDFRPQYSFIFEGKVTAVGAVADSFTVAGFWLKNTIGDTSGAVLANSQVFGIVPASAKGIIIDPAVRNTSVVNNNLVAISSPALGIDAGSGLDNSNTVFGNRGAALSSGVQNFGGGQNNVLSVVPAPDRTFLAAINKSGSAADPSGFDMSTTGRYGFYNFNINGGLQFQIYNGNGGAAANFGLMSGSVSGAAPSLSAAGSDANVPFAVLGKGTAGVRTGAYVRTVDPTTTDVPTGQCVDWNNTTAGTYKHVCNFGGTLRSVTMN